VFKGTFTAPGTVEVRSGNAPVLMDGFVGQKVTFDLTSARVVAADRNGDHEADLTEVGHGDVVLIQARINVEADHRLDPDELLRVAMARQQQR
jgi:hypothetical protein